MSYDIRFLENAEREWRGHYCLLCNQWGEAGENYLCDPGAEGKYFFLCISCLNQMAGKMVKDLED